MPAILNKSMNYRELYAGRFGNALRQWSSSDALLASGFDGLVSVRCADNPKGNRPFEPHLSVQEAACLMDEWEIAGLVVNANESPPDHLLVMNAEVSLYDGLLNLEYSSYKAAMRESLAHGRSMEICAKARLTLQNSLSEASYRDIVCLVESYPNHVVEFSAFSVFVGDLCCRNAVVWEVRAY